MEHPKSEKPIWSTEAIILANKISDGTIMAATREELEWYLIVLTNAPWDVMFDKMKAQYITVIRELVQLRTTTELAAASSKSNRKSRAIAWTAIGVSLLSVLVSLGAAVFKNSKTVINTPAPIVVAPTNAIFQTNLFVITNAVVQTNFVTITNKP